MSKAALSDSGLMRELAAGEVRALEALYDRYSAKAYGYALKICRAPHLAEEAVQSAFVTVWEKRELYDADRAEFSSWFFAILRNRCIDILRRERPAFSIESADALADVGPSLDEVVDNLHLRRSVRSLPERFREVILLAYFGGYTHVQLAEILGLPLGTVKSRIRLGLEKLAEVLKREVEQREV